MNHEAEREEIDQLIGKPRGWVLRWGMVTVLMVVVCLLLLGALISYPDELPGSIRLYAGPEPVEVRSLRATRVADLLVANGEEVRAGDWLGLAENSARLSDIRQLQRILDSLPSDPDVLTQKEFPPLSLGSLQADYSAVRFQAEWIRSWQEGDRSAAKDQLLRKQQAALTTSALALERQDSLLREEMMRTDSSLARQRALFERGAISLVELEAYERAASRSRREREELTVRRSANRQERDRLEQLRVELDEDRSRWLADQTIVLRQKLFELQNRLSDWVLENVWTAPSAGLIYLTEAAAEGQPVKAGELLFTLLPAGEGHAWQGVLLVPETGLGKIRLGAAVEIRLAGYPEPEYGIITGEVTGISRAPEEGIFRLEVGVSTPLRTTYDHEIPSRPVLTGEAVVITDKRSLLSRIFDQVRAGLTD